VLIAAVVLVAAACSNSESSGGSTTTSGGGSGTTASDSGKKVAVSAPGVTDTEIRVGSVASVTNPLGGKYQNAALGTQAYFDMVNSEGGIYGRKLVLATTRDDKVSNNSSEVKGLIDQDNVFAALPMAALLFTGSEQLVSSGVPTFGWIINPEWQGTPENPKANLFGQNGSFLCLGCDSPIVPYMAKESGKKKIGLLGYNVPQSSECVDGLDKSFAKYGKEAGAEVVFKDSSLSYGTTDLSVQVSKMKDAGVDMAATCIDANGVVTLAKELKKQEVKAIQYLPNAYDQDLLTEYGDLFQGSYVVTSFAPLELKKNKPQGLKDFETWMGKAGSEISENSMVGWINAAQFVQGLREAGPDFSRQKVIDAINKETDFTADGLLSGVDWTTAHTQRGNDICTSIVKIEDSQFVPQTGKDGAPFICWDYSSGNLNATYE
jgi:branched-chain amino acid transport system substrate-binding protein